MFKIIEGIFLVVLAVKFPGLSKDIGLIILSIGLFSIAMGMDDLFARRK